MPNSLKGTHSGHSRVQKIGLIAAAVVVVTGGVALARAYAVPAVVDTSGASLEERGPQTVVIYATPLGFQPAELTLRPGQRRFLIRNATGLDDIEFAIAKSREQPVRTPRRRNGENAALNHPLTPGEHRITEARHPEWECRITVTP